MPATFATYIANGTAFDRITRWASARHGDLPKCSHIELLASARPARSALCRSASKRDGFQFREATIEFKPGHWRFWTFEDMDAIQVWQRSSLFLGVPYDLLGAVLSVTPFARPGAGTVFCSDAMGILCDMPNPHTLTPSDWEREAARRGARMTTLPPEND